MLAVCSILLVACAAALFVDLLYERRQHNRRAQFLRQRMSAEDGQQQTLHRAQCFALFRKLFKPHLDVTSDLPQLIDVVNLGMEGGLTFEIAFDIYAQRFDTQLALECRPYAMSMREGVVSREDALNELSQRLKDRSFDRFVRMVNRAVGAGSKLAPMLDNLAQEVRKTRKSNLEERIAKAPTKMLLPTGVLILPAMLILIAGPFLTQLIGQL